MAVRPLTPVNGASASYYEATDEYRANDWRLCTADEVGSCCDGSCGYDGEMVWTSSSCTPPAAAHIAAVATLATTSTPVPAAPASALAALAGPAATAALVALAAAAIPITSATHTTASTIASAATPSATAFATPATALALARS